MFDKSKKEIAKIFPLLKSNLQKQIRRGEKEALATASLMLNMNNFEFLRRLSIIAAEDVELSIETTVIVWLMSATSKGFVLTPFHKNYILSYITSLLSHPICRRLIIRNRGRDGVLNGGGGEDELEEEGEGIYNEKLSLSEIMNSDYPDKEMLAAIHFRISFGGLKGDSLMISRLCDEIIKSGRRLTYLKKEECLKMENIKNENIKNGNEKLRITDSAIDFHIYSKLLLLIEKDTGIDVNTIKSTIWECSSRINYRYPEKSSLTHIWEKISPSFTFHTKNYLLYLFS
jgi:hypothetical protein